MTLITKDLTCTATLLKSNLSGFASINFTVTREFPSLKIAGIKWLDIMIHRLYQVNQFQYSRIGDKMRY
jgi:hypothetical protein